MFFQYIFFFQIFLFFLFFSLTTDNFFFIFLFFFFHLQKPGTQLLILVHASKMKVDKNEDDDDDDASKKKSKKSESKIDDDEIMTGESGDLEIFIFDLHSGDFVPKTITVDSKTAMTKVPPAMGMGPLIDPMGSDYLFIVHGGIIRIISMNTNHIVSEEDKSIPKSQRSKMDVSGSLMIAKNFTRIYYVGHNGTQIREAITKNKNTHIHRRELAVISRMQLGWEVDDSLVRLHTAATEQRNRGLDWDISNHNVFRELQGTVLEMVSNAMEQSEESGPNGAGGD